MSAKTAASSVRLSESLKALIAAPHALGSAIPAPPRPAFQSLFNKISSTAEKNGAKNDVWLTLSTGALVAVNSPASLCELYDFASEKRGKDLKEQIRIAAIMREVGLKCIGFVSYGRSHVVTKCRKRRAEEIWPLDLRTNTSPESQGYVETINALGALRAHLSEDVKAGLSIESLRQPTEHNVNATQIKARSLWDGIYEPHASKLLAKLAQSHPDLPVHILSSHYGPLFSDPVDVFPEGHFKIGRVLTSVVAIACLRAQQGVGPQLTSHVFGLKKALLEGGGAEGEVAVEGQEWLTSDEGVKWALESVDGIAEVVVGRGRSSFAGSPGGEVKAKL